MYLLSGEELRWSSADVFCCEFEELFLNGMPVDTPQGQGLLHQSFFEVQSREVLATTCVTDLLTEHYIVVIGLGGVYREMMKHDKSVLTSADTSTDLYIYKEENTPA